MTWVFWATFFIPWLLDLWGGQGVLLSIFGAVIWGAALGAALVGGNTKDAQFRRKCYLLLVGLVGGWLIYWAGGLLYPAANLAPRRPFLITLFIFFHAGLLSSALGLMAILFLTSLGWLMHEYLLSKSSWERRETSRLRLPSLESLARGSRNSIRLAFRVWGMGLFLAAVTTYLRGREVAMEHDPALYTWQWASDPKVIFTALLWIFLYLGVHLERLFSAQKRWRYRGYLAFSVTFVGLFIWFMSSGSTFIHSPVEWFSR